MSNTTTNNEEKLVCAKNEKDKGNEFFKVGNITEALRHYHQALFYLNGLQNHKSFAIFRKEQEEEPKNDPLQEEIMKTTSVIYSNMAACLIKNGKWSKAIEYSDKALKNDPENTKALYRRVQALIKDGNTTKAREDLKKLKEKNPDDAAVKREWQNLLEKEKEQDRKQRKELGGMFNRARKQEEKEEAKKQQNQEPKISEIKEEPKISEIKEEPKISEIKEPKIYEIKEDEQKITEIRESEDE
ncbi:6478_t:CDS:2 [Acaulospora colombiana]|uniref:6478_t:CDS:1 n=1 Tax=Acaulospora colombiana TaxID=27376 RepID=A0ACA9KQH6_9GLOM|nr:6478_t:CDS:2 [Acaulospora colombiana]